MENKLVNNTKAAMESEMKCPIGSKAAKTAAGMKEIDNHIDADGDIASLKMSMM